MPDTDTKILDTSIPAPDLLVSSTATGTENIRYRKPHPVNHNIMLITFIIIEDFKKISIIKIINYNKNIKNYYNLLYKINY